MSADPVIAALEALAQHLRHRQRRLDQLHDRLSMSEHTSQLAALRHSRTASRDRSRTRRRAVLGLVMAMQFITIAVLFLTVKLPAPLAAATAQPAPAPAATAQPADAQPAGAQPAGAQPALAPAATAQPALAPAATAQPAPAPAPVCAPGRACSPIPIDTLPFRAAGDTREAEDSQMYSYSCEPTTGEAGPEVWYAVTITEPGRLTARIQEQRGDSTDIDLHLLSAPSDSACVTRGDSAIAADVAPGEYFVIADTCSAWNGIPLPGPYELEVLFTPR